MDATVDTIGANDATYVRFNAPKNSGKVPDESTVGRVAWQLAAWALQRLISLVIPLANPDFENKIDEVQQWLVECDRASGFPEREIGLDYLGKAIVKMPFKENCGYWTDNNLLLDEFKEHFFAVEITKQEFEQKWATLDE